MRLFERKISDTTMRGFNIDEVTRWMDNVETVEKFKYYYYARDAKRPTESKNLTNQPVAEVLSFLSSHFVESPESFVEVQKKAFKSGRHQVIFKAIAATATRREITKIAILEYMKQ
ncbi:MAG TPA: hypothetical protein VJ249_11040 [Candidatus Bathyarchaeia archaeon]|nr:hypothetical protein [Candidatus Bathyarchaeia archaeon]